MGYIVHVDPDNLDQLGQDMIDMAGFLDGGTSLGTGDGESADLTDRVDTMASDALGLVNRAPSPITTDQRNRAALPGSAVQDFADTWEAMRAGIAADLRTVGDLLQQAGQSYEDHDAEVRFQIVALAETPPAPAVIGDPHLTG